MASGHLTSSLLASDLLLSQIHKCSEEANKSDFLVLVPDVHKEQSCKFTRTIQVLDTTVGL